MHPAGLSLAGIFLFLQENFCYPNNGYEVTMVENKTIEREVRV
jgi:hypothetical protein